MLLSVYTLILAASAFLFSAAGNFVLIRMLPALRMLDTPNERSNHAAPIPRGGGLAVVVTCLFFLTAALADYKLLIAMAITAIISFADDRHGEPPLRRVLIHAVAAMLAVSAIKFPVFHGLIPLVSLPLPGAHVITLDLDHWAAAILLIYFMNIFNFMDGIDEISVVETMVIGLGILALLWVDVGHELPGSMGLDAMIATGAMLGFWLYNRHPAKMFLGDVGSVPIGLLLGWLLLLMASQGMWAAALILPAYYVTDASSTLLFRILSGKKPWQAHSEHAYQWAARRGISHDRISQLILAFGFCLIAFAVLSTLPNMAWVAVAGAYGCAVLFTFLLRGGGRGAQRRLPSDPMAA